MNNSFSIFRDIFMNLLSISNTRLQYIQTFYSGFSINRFSLNLKAVQFYVLNLRVVQFYFLNLRVVGLYLFSFQRHFYVLNLRVQFYFFNFKVVKLYLFWLQRRQRRCNAAAGAPDREGERIYSFNFITSIWELLNFI